MNRVAAVLTFALLSVLSVEAAAELRPVVGTSAQQAGSATDAVSCGEFSRAIDHYLSIRRGVQSEVLPLRVTTDVAEIRDRSNALALAIQRARGNARPGEFFDARCARVISERFARALDGFDVADFLEGLNDEPSDRRPPQIHMRYPVASSMATMPANLLAVLPALPPTLEYRLIGRNLVLRDVDAALILDYFADALPSVTRPANGQR
jgi:hypothetical protein